MATEQKPSLKFIPVPTELFKLENGAYIGFGTSEEGAFYTSIADAVEAKEIA